MITQERLRELLDYNAETGQFIWRASRGKAMGGSVAGNINPVHGYNIIGVEGSLYRAHRLAWFYVYGKWPKDQIDHIDGDKTNNAISNLREATSSENQHNKGKQANNTSGYKGVWWHQRHKKWYAQIYANRSKYNLGHFDDPEKAAQAYEAAAQRLHGAFANKGTTEKVEEETQEPMS